MSTIRVVSAIGALGPVEQAVLFERSTSGDSAVRERVADIIARVRRDGDAVLLDMARHFDGAMLTSLEVPRDVWCEARRSLEQTLVRAMERARANIESVHRAFAPRALEREVEPGISVGRRPDPLDRVGVYAPGGQAAYPSSVLMGIVPAVVAGVGEIIVCSPPNRSGAPAPVVLAAAAIAGAHRVFALGGAGAVAAMAYGTESVPRVDRIVGPGNAYVAEAKLQLSGVVGIDSPAGPSELLVIADERASAEVVAREMLAQAEHDPLACVVAVGIGEDTCPRIVDSIERALPQQRRRDIVAHALASRGAVLSAASLDEAVEFSNRYAPEHLLLAVADPAAALEHVRNAGTVFLGETSSVAFGDYMSGANHVLPTGGLARSYSGLSTLDFIRWTTFQRIDPAAAGRLAADVGTFADAEGLPGHAAAARAWLPGGSP